MTFTICIAAVVACVAAFLAPQVNWPKYVVVALSMLGLFLGVALWFSSAYYRDPSGMSAGWIGEPTTSRMIILLQWFGYSIPAFGYMIGWLIRKGLRKAFV